jgi:hypothetical protein
MPTKDKSIWVRSRVERVGLDWNGDHQIFNATENAMLYRTRTGVGNPKWKQQVLNGQNATTPMTGVIDDIVSVPGFVNVHSQKPGGGGPYYDLMGRGDIAQLIALRAPFDWVSPSNTIAYNRALIAYLKEVDQVNRAFSGGVFLGELRETMRMIKNPAEGLRNILGAYYTGVVKLKKKQPKNWKKNLSGAWLEACFGMLPLIHDIQDGAKAYNRLVEEPALIPVTAVGVYKSQVANRCFTELLAGLIGLYCPKVLHTQKSNDIVVVRFRGKVKRESRATIAGKAQLFGFDPLQFLPTAYELMPWSFLIDYFSNLGDIIETGVVNRSAIAWTNVSTSTIMEKNHYVSVADKGIQQGDGDQKRVSGTACTAKHTRRKVDRSTPSDLGWPRLELELPGLPAQWSNMTALFTQATLDVGPQRRIPGIRRTPH